MSIKQPRSHTCRRYGVCARTVERWERDPDLNFPPPTKIRGRKYDDEDELTAWDNANAAKSRAA
jgi:hypothetical protein